MGGIKGFEQLSGELPEDERKELLKEISEDLKLYPDENEAGGEGQPDEIPAQTPPEDEEEGSLSDAVYAEKVYKKIPIFERIVIFFLRIFTGKTLGILLEEYLLHRLSREIDSDFPGLLDIRGNKLKERFYNEIAMLAAGLEVFSEPVSFIAKNRVSGFYRYAASKEMSGFEEELIKKTDPDKIFAGSETGDPEGIRAAVMRNFDEVFDSVEPEEKKEMYEIAKSFFYISQTASFPFESMKKMFIIEPNGNRACSFVNARKLLGQLDSLISSMTTEMIRYDRSCDYIFDFYYSNNETSNPQQQAVPADDSYAVKTKKKAVNALSQLFAFRNTLPLKKILKLMYKNLDYKPVIITGGEEWFSIYRKALREEVENTAEKYIYRMKKKGILKKLKNHIADMQVEDRDYFVIRHNDREFRLVRCNILYLLFMFHEKYYVPRVEKIVSNIMLDGIFYKDTNRKELNESFNLINSFSETYAAFTARTRTGNEVSRELSAVALEESSAVHRKRKTENIIKSLNSEGYRMFKTYYEAFVSIKNILGGISNGTPSGRYDTLSNLSIVCEEKTSMSVQSIDRLYRQLSEILNLFREYDELLDDNT